MEKCVWIDYLMDGCLINWAATQVFVLFESLRPSQQSFSKAGMGLPGLNQ